MFHPNSRKLQDWSLPQSWMSWPQPAGDLFALRQITWSSRFWGFGVLRSQEVWTPEQKTSGCVWKWCVYTVYIYIYNVGKTCHNNGMLIEHIWKKWWQTLDLKVALFWDETNMKLWNHWPVFKELTWRNHLFRGQCCVNCVESLVCVHG